MCCVLTRDDGHYDHVEHVVQQQRDGHRHQHQLPLVGALLQRVPPLLPVLADGLVAGQEGDVEVVDAHDAGIPVSLLWSQYCGPSRAPGLHSHQLFRLPVSPPSSGTSGLSSSHDIWCPISANKISIETKLVISSGGERAQYPVPGPAQCRVSEQPGVCLMPHQRGTTSPHGGEQGRIERDRVELNHQEKSFSFSILSQAKVKLWL